MRKRTGRTAAFGSLLAAGLLCLGATAAHAQHLVVSQVSGDPGTPVTISVSLSTGGTQVAGTQSDIGFDAANIPIAAKSNGKPNCIVNANLLTPDGVATDKSATSFAFRPNGCTGAACNTLRALVLSTDNVDALADGSVLFTCTVNIAATASGPYPLTLSGVILSDPNGNQVTDVGDVNGQVTANGGPPPTATAGASCPTPRPAPAGPALWIPDQTGASSISVTLAIGSAQIAGTQSDITWDTAPIAAKANGKPNCTVNANLLTPGGVATDKSATSFAFRPNGCGGTSGVACTAVRALVLSTDNVDALADGSVLFTCSITPPASGTATFTFSGVILSDPNGNQVTDAGDQGGEDCVGGVVVPTPTPTAAAPVCPSARPAPAGPALWVPDQCVTPGATTGSISVTLATGDAQIAGTQSDITWDTAPIAAKANGKPDCTVNANLLTPGGVATDKSATSFAFRPNGCGGSNGVACTAVRALVLSTDNVDALADGSVLFTCNVTLPTSGTATYTFSGVILSDPNGNQVTDAGDQGGRITILSSVSPTATNTTAPTPTSPPPPPTVTPTTAVPIPTTAVPTATATQTFTPSSAAATPTSSSGGTLEDEGGCQIGAAGHSSSGWLLLIPAMGVLVLRRRRR